MTTQPKLEAYLSALDRALGQISVSDRADIIVEIKSHIMEAQEKSPTESLDTILNSLGDPETVAKRYLQERGIQPVVTPVPVKNPNSMKWVSDTIKWLVIGFVSVLALLILTIGLIIWRFTPLVSVDDTHNKVSIGGGIINVTGEKNPVIKRLPATPANNSVPDNN